MSEAHVQQLLSFFGQVDKWPWSQEMRNTISKQRQRMDDGKLFIDLLLEFCGISDYDSLYPPRSKQCLEDLLSQISSSPTFNILKQDCLVYYLLLDLPPSASTSPARTFASNRLLPPSWVKSMDGWHSLDMGSYRAAIRNLSDPLVRPDWVGKIYNVLSNAQNGAELVLTFWRLGGRERLEDLATVGIVMDALVEVGEVEEAWELGKRRDRTEYIERILAFAFGDNWTKKPIEISVNKLTTLPMSEDEEKVAEGFCISPTDNLYSNEKNTKLLQDWWTMRLIGEGRYQETLQFLHKLPSTPFIDDTDRRYLINSIEHLLPSLERSLLALSLTPPAPSTEPVVLSTSYEVTKQVWQPSIDSTPSTPSMTLKPPSTTPAHPPPSVTSKNVPLTASPIFRTNDGGDPQRSLLRALHDQNVKMGRLSSRLDFMGSPSANRNKKQEPETLDEDTMTPLKSGTLGVSRHTANTLSASFSHPFAAQSPAPMATRSPPPPLSTNAVSAALQAPTTPSTVPGLGTVPFVPFAIAAQAVQSNVTAEPSTSAVNNNVSPLKRNRDGTPVSNGSGSEPSEGRRKRSVAPEPITPKNPKSLVARLNRQETGKFLKEMKSVTAVPVGKKKSKVVSTKKPVSASAVKKIEKPGKQFPGGWTDGTKHHVSDEELEEDMAVELARETTAEPVKEQEKGLKRKVRASATPRRTTESVKRKTSVPPEEKMVRRSSRLRSQEPKDELSTTKGRESMQSISENPLILQTNEDKPLSSRSEKTLKGKGKGKAVEKLAPTTETRVVRTKRKVT